MINKIILSNQSEDRSPKSEVFLSSDFRLPSSVFRLLLKLFSYKLSNKPVSNKKGEWPTIFFLLSAKNSHPERQRGIFFTYLLLIKHLCFDRAKSCLKQEKKFGPSLFLDYSSHGSVLLPFGITDLTFRCIMKK